MSLLKFIPTFGEAAITALPGGPWIVAGWKFLTSRVGVVIVCSVLAAASGYNMARQTQERVVLQAQLTAAEQRIADMMEIADAASQRERAAAAELAKEHEKVLAYDALIAKTPGSKSCVLTGTDLGIGRMRK
jgi:hypothetical protein